MGLNLLMIFDAEDQTKILDTLCGIKIERKLFDLLIKCNKNQIEFQNHQDWKGPLEIIYSNPSVQEGSPAAGDIGTCPGRFGMSPQREPPCPTLGSSMLCHPPWKKALPHVEVFLYFNDFYAV